MSKMTRRKFITTGAKGIAVASVPLFFRFDPMAALAAPSPDSLTLTDYLQHFGVDENIIRDIMATALERGGDYCDLYFEHSIGSYIGLEDNIVNRAYTNIDFGVGIRVLKGDQTGYSFTEEITPKAMKLAAQTAANIASGAKTASPSQFNTFQPPQYYPAEIPWEEVKIDRKIPLLEKLNTRVNSLDTRIIKSRASISDDTTYMLFTNSDGLITFDYRPHTRLAASCSAEQNGHIEEGFWDLASRSGFEFYNPEKVDNLADQVVSRTIRLFDAVKPEAGEMEVVLAAGESGILLHEAIGHGMEADCNRKKESIYHDKIGKPVAENIVSIVDDGTLPHMHGSINIDDEGIESQKTYLVENGILQTYMHDRISSQYYNVKQTANGRRESFRFHPMPRMRNTYMLPGPHTEEEIIASVKKGLYTESFTNGQVLIGPGDFTFYVKSGNLIENGKLTKPVKDINIIGNGPEVLKNIVMVADNLKFAQGDWRCGKAGQRIPASQGQPTVKVTSITVGGVDA